MVPTLPRHGIDGIIDFALEQNWSSSYSYRDVYEAPDCMARRNQRRGNADHRSAKYVLPVVSPGNEDQAGRFDLSSLRYAWIGAEPVFVEQITSFVSRFTSAGLMENVLQPCYGLAEAVVLVTARHPQNPPLELQFDRDQLRAGKIVPLEFARKIEFGCLETVLL